MACQWFVIWLSPFPPFSNWYWSSRLVPQGVDFWLWIHLAFILKYLFCFLLLSTSPSLTKITQQSGPCPLRSISLPHKGANLWLRSQSESKMSVDYLCLMVSRDSFNALFLKAFILQECDVFVVYLLLFYLYLFLPQFYNHILKMIAWP